MAFFFVFIPRHGARRAVGGLREGYFSTWAIDVLCCHCHCFLTGRCGMPMRTLFGAGCERSAAKRGTDVVVCVSACLRACERVRANRYLIFFCSSIRVPPQLLSRELFFQICPAVMGSNSVGCCCWCVLHIHFDVSGICSPSEFVSCFFFQQQYGVL